MNRRDFLKSLAALGSAALIAPEAIASLSEAQIDTAWASALDEPATFYVSSWGSLATTPGYDYPGSRRELYDIQTGDIDADGLIRLAGDEWRIDDVIRTEYEDVMADAGVEDPDDNWEDWLRRADEDTLATVQMAVDRWLDDMGPEDFEYADLHGQSSRGEALQFFRDECDTCDIFNIAIVEGDHPGSTYYAAELRMDVDEANVIAERKGIPIRFAWEG